MDERERNALEGGSEADSCLIQSILISKKIFEECYSNSLSKLGHNLQPYCACRDCFKSQEAEGDNCPLQ